MFFVDKVSNELESKFRWHFLVYNEIKNVFDFIFLLKTTLPLRIELRIFDLTDRRINHYPIEAILTF
jgi:hypothetical protein